MNKRIKGPKKTKRTIRTQGSKRSNRHLSSRLKGEDGKVLNISNIIKHKSKPRSCTIQDICREMWRKGKEEIESFKKITIINERRFRQAAERTRQRILNGGRI